MWWWIGLGCFENSLLIVNETRHPQHIHPVDVEVNRFRLF